MAVEVLQRGRDVLMQDMAEQILDRSEDFEEGGFLFQEFLENQGSKLHFLYLMISQMEQSAEIFEEQNRVTSETELPILEGAEEMKASGEYFGVWADEQMKKDAENVAEAQEEPKPKRRKRKPRIKAADSGLPSPTDENE